MDERQWIHAIQKGHKEYLQDIAEKYYDDIFRFCAFQTGSREEAYDLAQETFLRFIRYVEGYRDHNLKGYLLTIAMNVCRNYLARARRERAVEMPLWEDWQQGMEPRSSCVHPAQEHFDAPGKAGKAAGLDSMYPVYLGGGQAGEGLPEQRAVEADVHVRLMEAMAGLPEMQREAILLHYLYDMKYREIGRRTGVTAATAKSRVRQGMDKLQAVLRKEDFLDG